MLLCAAERTLQINQSFFLLCFHFVFAVQLASLCEIEFIFIYIYIFFVFGATDIL